MNDKWADIVNESWDRENTPLYERYSCKGDIVIGK